MNKSIESLIAQATDEILGVNVLDKKMFAHLLIQECAMILADHGEYESSTILKDHFGINHAES